MRVCGELGGCYHWDSNIPWSGNKTSTWSCGLWGHIFPWVEWYLPLSCSHRLPGPGWDRRHYPLQVRNIIQIRIYHGQFNWGDMAHLCPGACSSTSSSVNLDHLPFSCVLNRRIMPCHCATHIPCILHTPNEFQMLISTSWIFFIGLIILLFGQIRGLDIMETSIINVILNLQPS